MTISDSSSAHINISKSEVEITSENYEASPYKEDNPEICTKFEKNNLSEESKQSSSQIILDSPKSAETVMFKPVEVPLTREKLFQTKE